MEQSILTSTKKILGLEGDNTDFDVDVITHINTVLSTLTQLGIGPTEGFQIEDTSASWDDLLSADPGLNFVKSYLYLQVRMLFDPPATSYTQAAMNRQIEQLEWRINVYRENQDWTPG